ncbi:probable G-protein coupled receptor 34b isoform X2 [Nerophis lumbriciformis]|uniref:probable G-protein coupled receptor 34b isoform X2 n=1 Tax=Nerophis lumbriciformis TaxID=546530 RepID=UPI002ADF033C|nr:probable G-protein coupled receptor 34 isoform X2 [Nerophis lumbriciformis]
MTAPDPQESCVRDHTTVGYVLAVCYSVIFVLGLIGNVVALWAFFRVDSKRNSVIFFHSEGNRWMLGATLCTVVTYIFYMNMYMSITLLGLISVNRYMKIHQGIRSHNRLLSTRWSVVICVGLWIVAVVMDVVFIATSSTQSHKCYQYKQLQNTKWKAYVNMFLLALYWLAFISLVVSHVTIHRKLRNATHTPNARCYSRTAWKSLFILFVFTICSAPYHVIQAFYIRTQITEASCYWRNAVNLVVESTLLLSSLNACLDPIMYFILASSMRKEVWRITSIVFGVKEAPGLSSSSSSIELEEKTAKADGKKNIPATLQ